MISLPTMPYPGTVSTTIRRSVSSRRPVSSTCTGPGRVTASRVSGASWTWPSVIITAPANRPEGISAAALSTAAVIGVPSLPSGPAPGTSMIRTSRSGFSARLVCRLSSAVRARARRSPVRWLGEVSTAITAMSPCGVRSSLISRGSSRATASSTRARARQTVPRARREAPIASSTSPMPASAATSGHGSSGDQVTAPLTARAFPEWPEDGPDRPCSFRSGCTSPG